NQGGVEQVLLTYAHGLDREKYRITVACLEGGTVAGEIAALKGVDVIVIQTTSRLMRLLEFSAIARRVKPHITHNHACWYGLLVGLLVGSRRVETLHNIYHWLNWHERLRYGLYCLLANRIIAVSQAVMDFGVGFFPFMKKEKFSVIYNGVDPDAMNTATDTGALRERHRLPVGVTVVGFMGRLTEQKGLSYLLQADASLMSNEKVVFLIVGDGELRAALEEEALKLKLTNVIFAGFQRDVAGYLAMFDIFVLPSLWEGLPVALVEAMAVGKPVVATAVSGTPEVVTDGETGFLVEPKNVDQLAERITRLIEDPSLRDRMGRAARIRVKEKFSAATMIRATEQLYQELLESQ
ncbi:MAG TPA: glycosyltransferase family 4 protein, partial [Bacteroidota bacterium]